MLYTRIVHGWVEQVYSFDGKCLAQKFVSDESRPIERRAYREASDGPQRPDQLEHDQIIEHPEDVDFIESKERFCDIILIQPQDLGIPAKR